MRQPVRLGAVSYLNVEPLLPGLENDERFIVSREVPSRIADELHWDFIDVGMIPSIEYATGEYAIVKGIGIASRGPVRSVCLFHREPLAKIRTVTLDAGSRTSVALLRIILDARGIDDYETVTMEPDIDRMLQSADAALVIGDRALAYSGEADVLDLGEAWWSLTKLPFVYAFWAGRPGVLDADHLVALERAAEDGLADIARVAARYNGSTNLDFRAKERYLRENIVFRLGDEEYAGLAEFYRRAQELGILSSAPALRFYGER